MSPRLRRGLIHPPACERRLPVGVPPLDQRLLPHPASGGSCLPDLGARGQVLLAFDAAFVALLSLLQAIRYRMGRSSVGSGMASSPGRPTPTVLRPP